MTDITTIFCDLGGVLLTDGWGHASRKLAAEKFDLDWEDLRHRHEYVSHAIETAEVSLEQYLDRVIFCRPRSFTREEFKAFMFAQSQPHEDTIAVIKQIAGSRKYQMATLNNEILELNQYRIERFGLRQYFPIFFSSCFMRMRKPDEAIYRAALSITQRAPEECLFIDDREENLECPRALGLKTIHFQNLDQFRAELQEKGVETSTDF
jgi:putative hydrolase of the HAD superfamily